MSKESMTPRPRVSAGVLAVIVSIGTVATQAQNEQSQPLFKSGVDLVRVSAIVRDQKGKFVENLSAADFEVLDSGQPRSIAEFQRELADVSIALLFDVSGSMEGHLNDAREAAT